MKLPKFINQNEITDQLSSALLEDAVKRSQENYSSTINPEDITGCLRRMYYKVRCQKNSEDLSFINISHKDYIVDKWAHYFSKCKKTILVDKNIHVAHSEYNLSGFVDAYMEFKEDRFMVKVRPVPSAVFENIKEKGAKRKHVIEVSVYLWMSEFQDGLLIYENNDTQDYVMFHIVPYEPIIRSVKDKCKKLIGHQMRGTEPDRIKDAGDIETCRVCEYNKICLI